MRRSVLKIACIVSGIVFAIHSIFLIILAMQMLNVVGSSAQTSIIGGAGAPTLAVMLQMITRTPMFYGAVLSFLLFVGTGLTLIIKKSKA